MVISRDGVFVLIESACARAAGQHLYAGIGKIFCQHAVDRIGPARGQCNFGGAEMFECGNVRFKIGVARQAGALFGFGQNFEHAFTAQRGSHWHPGQRHAIYFFLCQQIKAIPQRRQIFFHSGEAVFTQIQPRSHQHHAFRCNAVKLIGVLIGIKVGNNVAKLIPRADDGHVLRLLCDGMALLL